MKAIATLFACALASTAFGQVPPSRDVNAALGAALDQAVKSARPPVFFRREGAFQRAVRIWSLPALDLATARLWDAERACKRTGSPADTICRSAVIGLAQRAAVARRR